MDLVLSYPQLGVSGNLCSGVNFAPPFSGTTESNPTRRKIKLVATNLEGLTVTCSTKVSEAAFICQNIN